MTKDIYDEEGYRIVPYIKPEKGIKCGRCGMKFDHGQAHGFYCPHSDCPTFTRVSF